MPASLAPLIVSITTLPSRIAEMRPSLESLLAMGGGQAQHGEGTEADLPPALIKELSPKKRDRLEQQIVAVLAACNGQADLDAVLIGLYRGFGVIAKRRVIQNKLWRLVRTGRICKAKNTRNVFSLVAAKPQARRAERRR